MAGALNSVYVALVFVMAIGGVFGVYAVTQDVTTDSESRLGLAIAAIVTLFVIGAVIPLLT
jgi:succinate dehydrogenase hydrophobic anchor subunit